MTDTERNVKMELKRAEFAVERKGYSTVQVEEYISYVLSAYAEIEKAYAELDRKYRAAQAGLEEAKKDENTISTIIVSAQKMADTIINDAKEKARVINSSLEASCDEIIAQYVGKVKAEREKLQKAEKAVEDFKESLYSAYKEHLGAIDRILPYDDAEKKMSEVTDDELVDSAYELAKDKCEAEEDDTEIVIRKEASDEE